MLAMSTKMFCLTDVEAHAEKTLSEIASNFFKTGSNDETSLRWNTEAFQRYRLRPRVLRDVSNVDMRTQLLGEHVDFPIGVSPTALHCVAHPDGEVATAKACSSMKTLMIAGLLATKSLEEVAEASGRGRRWMQIYIYRDRSITRDIIRRAELAGYTAIVVTIDSPTVPKTIAHHRDGGMVTGPIRLANVPPFKSTSNKITPREKLKRESLDPSLCWDDIRWLCSITHLPIVVKGVLTAEDAELAVESGVAGILVSNHGGRQLNTAVTAIDALSEVVGAVRGRVEVYMDGGVRQGTDVLKALAMGARAVFIGRPALWGLAYNGTDGVREVLQILKDELKLAMMLSGCARLSDIAPEMVVHESYYKIPRARL